MKTILHVPDPCSERWEAMAPDGTGRYCTHCAHTVIDFSDWDTPAIAAYLQAQAGQRICGRFRNSQLEQPFELISLAPRIIAWQSGRMLHKIAALIVICFAISSCNDDSTAPPKPAPPAITEQTHTLGEPAPVADTAIPPPSPARISIQAPPIPVTHDPLPPEPATMGAPVVETVQPDIIPGTDTVSGDTLGGR